MNRAVIHKPSRPSGSAMVEAIILTIVILAAMAAVSAIVASRASTVSLQQKQDRALTSARSGTDIIFYILQEMKLSDSSGSATITQLTDELRTGLGALSMNGAKVELRENIVYISGVVLNDSTAQSFSARVTSEDGKTVLADVTGRADDVTRALRLKCNLATGAHLVFDPAAIPLRS